MLIHRLGFS